MTVDHIYDNACTLYKFIVHTTKYLDMCLGKKNGSSSKFNKQKVKWNEMKYGEQGAKECECACGRKTNKCAIHRRKKSRMRNKWNCLELTRFIFYSRVIIQLRSMNLWLNLRLNANNIIQFEPINKNVQKKIVAEKTPNQSKPNVCVRPCYCDPKISVIVACCHRLMRLFDFPCLSRSQSKNITMVQGAYSWFAPTLIAYIMAIWLAGWHPIHQQTQWNCQFPFLLFFLMCKYNCTEMKRGRAEHQERTKSEQMKKITINKLKTADRLST